MLHHQVLQTMTWMVGKILTFLTLMKVRKWVDVSMSVSFAARLLKWFPLFSAFTAAGLNLMEGDIVLDEVRSLINLFELNWLSKVNFGGIKADLGSLCAFCLPLLAWISTEANSELYHWAGVQVAKDHPILLGGRLRSECLLFFIWKNICLWR